MATPSEALAERRRTLESELVAVRREIRGARDCAGAAKRAAKRSLAHAWVLSDEVRDVTMIAFALAQYDPEPAVKYLRNVAMQRHWPKKSDAEVARLIDDCFDDATGSDAAMDALAKLADPTDPTNAAAMRAAMVYVEEWRVVTWARLQAVRKGLAVSTDLLLHQVETLRAKCPEAARLPPRGPSAGNRGRQWACRLRRRWGGRYGKFKVREIVPPPEMRSKAPHTFERITSTCVGSMARARHLNCKCVAVGGACSHMVNTMCATVPRRM